MAPLGFFFIALPCLAIAAFTGFAACRAQHHRAFKVLAAALLTAGLTCARVRIGIIVRFLTLQPEREHIGNDEACDRMTGTSPKTSTPFSPEPGTSCAHAPLCTPRR
ncbi:hypothetical protein [Streptomyces sp. NPDC059262]|uniref:hypothetical protein n=1 Tax=Streptomyces sp. NPDC059262 TaxID=3346797 RepID=UPI0036A33DDA